MHISVVSLGKSVASTSMATGLASVLHDRGYGALLVELDPSGGDLASMWGASTVVGVTNLVGAVAVDELITPGIIDDVAVPSPFGFPVVLAPSAYRRALDKVCSDLGGRYGRVLAAATTPVVCDAGRWRAHEPASDRVSGASVIIALFTPDPAGVTRVIEQLASLRTAAPGVPVLLAVVGENPYPVHEIEAALGGEQVIVVPSQRNVVRALMSGNGSAGQVRRLKKSLWWRSMARVIADAEQATGTRLVVRNTPVQNSTPLRERFSLHRAKDRAEPTGARAEPAGPTLASDEHATDGSPEVTQAGDAPEVSPVFAASSEDAQVPNG